jgi:hypothetical protein
LALFLFVPAFPLTLAAVLPFDAVPPVVGVGIEGFTIAAAGFTEKVALLPMAGDAVGVDGPDVVEDLTVLGPFFLVIGVVTGMSIFMLVLMPWRTLLLTSSYPGT